MRAFVLSGAGADGRVRTNPGMECTIGVPTGQVLVAKTKEMLAAQRQADSAKDKLLAVMQVGRSSPRARPTRHQSASSSSALLAPWAHLLSSQPGLLPSAGARSSGRWQLREPSRTRGRSGTRRAHA